MMKNEFDFDTPVNRRGTHCVKWDECRCEDELPLWVADMDFRTAPAIVEALIKRAEQGVFGYSFPEDDYYTAVQDWFERRHDWKIKREEIIYTTGIVPATSAVIKALTSPGDGVVIMTPVYTCFFSSIRNNDCKIIQSPLKMVDGRYEIDYDDLETKLALPESKILLLCNPHNPGGRVWTADELRRVEDLCTRHDVIVLSDEIHNEIVMPGFRYTPYALVATRPYVSMVSPSKSFNTAGLHTANIVCPSEEMRNKINRAININEICDIGPFGIEALIASYRHGEPWLEALIAYVYDNYKLTCDTLNAVPGIKVMKMEGSYLAWVDVSSLGVNSAELVENLRDRHHVWLQAGTAYGADGEGYIRINLATSRVTLTEALKRIKAGLTDHLFIAKQ